MLLLGSMTNDKKKTSRIIKTVSQVSPFSATLPSLFYAVSELLQMHVIVPTTAVEGGLCSSLEVKCRFVALSLASYAEHSTCFALESGLLHVMTQE